LYKESKIDSFPN